MTPTSDPDAGIDFDPRSGDVKLKDRVGNEHLLCRLDLSGLELWNRWDHKCEVIPISSLVEWFEKLIKAGNRKANNVGTS